MLQEAKGFPPPADQCSAPPLAANVQSDQKRNFEKANTEYRIMNIECRSKVFCLS
jgi:hypothetical protein